MSGMPDQTGCKHRCTWKFWFLATILGLSLLRIITTPWKQKRSKVNGGNKIETIDYTAVAGVCPPESYETKGAKSENERYCLTTLTDDLLTERWKGKARDVSTLFPMTKPLMETYASYHGYLFVDQSPVVNASRPTSWFKIQAVLNMFNEHACDWVLWVDADALIMNYTIPLDNYIPKNEEKEIVFSPDKFRLVNAGVFLIHNSPWTQHFLKSWWDMDQYIVKKKSVFSGDNEALGNIMRARWGLKMTDNEFRYKSNVLEMVEYAESDPKIQVLSHLCSMNSWARFGAPHLLRGRDKWFNYKLLYRRGDFIYHLAGIDDKATVAQSVLRDYYNTSLIEN